MHLWSRNTHKISGGFRRVGKNYEIQISLVDKARRPDSISSSSRIEKGNLQLRVSERFLYVDTGV